MRVQSIGWRTDLALRRMEGAEIVDRGDHLLVRTTSNPAYRWGNFLLFGAPPRTGEAQRWIERFELAFPDAEYLAIGLDSPSGELGEIGALRAAGVTVESDTVMTADRLRPPSREPPPAVFRELSSDDDWRQAVELRVAVDEDDEGPGYRAFLECQMQSIRAACRLGHGAWFGAFAESRLLSGLGIFGAGPGTARFQSVETHPRHRGRGLAGNLVLAASRYALGQLAAETLVIAADPDYLAIDIYRSLGFLEREQHVQLERQKRPPR